MSETGDVVERMWKKMAKSPFVMVGLTGNHDHSQPMTAQLDPDANGKFWFYTQKDNRLAPGGSAMAQFVSKDHTVFACIHGTLVEETNEAIKDKYWSKQSEAWFAGGRQDPKLLMLRFELDSAEIWEGDESLTGYFKMLTGHTIKPGEAGRHVEVSL